ncbi:hypothetical protein [Actinomadura madurae]|uniref:hypothetical protein n=1 Tax=Actinomadura madurae TaxID=1993 RepID=UPI0020D25725|nr:hypothetical protein [Actinomadura madurae]MCP9947346.1 hypothetical protein [Actinomadura madurae]MCP9964111.1 hypothetical protein [Actinomadura madurae]MCP9976583.1 hypothetical protein [Actinomadura madurae]MCQ0011920.1 hypothetical protein [Actinomadura madurae]MCQ0012780.1 hypothetical protein [Actinomadura madurae]
MSLTYTVTVTCDGCGEWEHTDRGNGTHAAARSRKRRGWVTKWKQDGRSRWDRRDYCPKCAGSDGEAGAAQHSSP